MSPYRLSKVEKTIRLVLEYIEAFNRHDVVGMGEMISEGCILDLPNPAPDGTKHVGKEAFVNYWNDFFQQKPTTHLEIEEIFYWGTRCVTRWRLEWEDNAGKKGSAY